MALYRNTYARQVSRKTAGFTLIEVLVALVLVGMALPALMLRLQSILDGTSYMQEKAYSYWVAQNRMEQYLLELEFDDNNRQARRNGSTNQGNVQAQQNRKKKKSLKKRETDLVEFNGQEWHVLIEREATEVDETYYVHISVGLVENNWTATLTRLVYDD